MNINWLLGTPKGRMVLQGSSRSTTYYFTLVVEGPNGRTNRRLPVDLQGDMKTPGDKPPTSLIQEWEAIMGVADDAPKVHMVPGPK